jgi:amino acid transporter
MLLAHVGLRVGKWVTNVGSAVTVVVIAFLALLPVFRVGHFVADGYHPVRAVMPPLTLFSFSVFSKMTFGALCGFEYAAIFAGESRNPARNLTRAIFISAPIIALLYIFGTSAILAYVSPDQVDVIGTIPQALRIATGNSPLGAVIVPLAIVFLLTNYLSSFSLGFAANARLPMCAGWDHLLPEWFTRLNPKHRTPINSILFLGGVTLAVSVAVLIGVGQQEAFELLQIWAFAFYGLAYIALFAIPLFVPRSHTLAAPTWLRVLAVPGLLLTLLYIAMSVVPIIPVASEGAYITKTVAVLLIGNLAALALYRFRPNRRSHSEASAPIV